MSNALLTNLWEHWVVGRIYTTVLGEKEQEKEICKIYNFPNDFCSEATGMMMLALSNPGTWLITHLSRDITCTDHVALMH